MGSKHLTSHTDDWSQTGLVRRSLASMILIGVAWVVDSNKHWKIISSCGKFLLFKILLIRFFSYGPESRTYLTDESDSHRRTLAPFSAGYLGMRRVWMTFRSLAGSVIENRVDRDGRPRGRFDRFVERFVRRLSGLTVESFQKRSTDQGFKERRPMNWTKTIWDWMRFLVRRSLTLSSSFASLHLFWLDLTFPFYHELLLRSPE